MSRKNGNNNSVDLDIGILSGHLWEAANILRGPVDAADFKTYIFPLLFFKRLSDVYDEEYAVALEESDGDVEFAQFPENHRFQVPEGCHWKEVRAKSANIGHALQQAMRCIEQANPDTLHGIFGDAQWTNKDRLSDALLKDLIEHFSSLNLGNEHCKADILGQAYEYVHLVQHGTTIPGSAYGTVFYLATGFHGLHVIGGLIAFVLLLARTTMSKFTPAQATAAIVVSYYWHFVDVVWIGLFLIIYVLK